MENIEHNTKASCDRDWYPNLSDDQNRYLESLRNLMKENNCQVPYPWQGVLDVWYKEYDDYVSQFLPAAKILHEHLHVDMAYGNDSTWWQMWNTNITVDYNNY